MTKIPIQFLFLAVEIRKTPMNMASIPKTKKPNSMPIEKSRVSSLESILAVLFGKAQMKEIRGKKNRSTMSFL